MFLSHRDLLKWCDRISVNFDGTSSATAQHVFHEVSGMIVSSNININHDELHFLLKLSEPQHIVLKQNQEFESAAVFSVSMYVMHI